MANEESTRRTFVITAIAAIVAAYGTFSAFLARFLYPSAAKRSGWTYVSPLSRVPDGEALVYRTPGGAIVNIARSADDAEQLMALSSTCPHLGCQVNWEPQNQRFFCPCHNGVFDPSGVGISGPPADAGQSLLQYPLKQEDGLLFIEVPSEELAQGKGSIIEPRLSDETLSVCRLPSTEAS